MKIARSLLAAFAISFAAAACSGAPTAPEVYSQPPIGSEVGTGTTGPR